MMTNSDDTIELVKLKGLSRYNTETLSSQEYLIPARPVPPPSSASSDP